MKESKFLTKDPIYGVTLHEATALHAERDGKTFYFCSDHCCRQKFLSTSAGAKTKDKAANDGVTSAAVNRVTVHVIRTDEKLMIARSVWRVERTALERKVPPRAGLAIE